MRGGKATTLFQIDPCRLAKLLGVAGQPDQLRRLEVAGQEALIGVREVDAGDLQGPRAVGVFYGTGSYFNGLGWPLMKSFLSELGSPNLFSTMTIDQSARWVTALRMGTMASGAYEPASVDTLMVVGKNLGADSLLRWLTEHGHPADRIATGAGFRVLRVTAGDTSVSADPTG